MEKQIEEILNTWKEKNIIVKQSGFIMNQYEIKKLQYKMEYEVLTIEAKEEKIYIKININQIYKMENKQEEIKLYLDNDTILILQKQ